MRLKLVSDVEDEAPSAMPSAAACITRPVVVDKLRDCCGADGSMKLSDSPSLLGDDDARCSPLPRFSREIW